MPVVTWENISDLKHSLAQERTIICGTIQRLKILDGRLQDFEDKIVSIIERGEENGKT